MRHHQRTAAVAAAALTATALVAAPATAAPNPNNADKLARAVTAQGVLKHLGELQKIADANGGNRGAGTSGYEASGAYVEKTLRAAGYTTRRQYFDFTYEHVNATALNELSPTARAIAQHPMSYSPATPAGGVSAQLVSPTTATGCAASDYAGVTATGKIALVQRGGCPFGQKATVARSVGAAAAIIYNNADGELNGTLGEVSTAYAPTTGITRAEGEALRAEMAKGAVTVRFVLDKVVETRQTFNVLAETATGRADNVVMLGAHLDSVSDGPGINDNGSGSATLLETAVQLGRANKVNNKVRFAWWAAEELGLVGSTHYVDDLVEHDPSELANIAGYLNFDMVGSPNYMIGVYDANQSTYQAPVAVPEGSVQLEKLLTDYFDRTHQPWIDTEFSGRSDYQAFIENGIPASGLFTGAEGRKTEAEAKLFGGQAGVAYDVNYHAPGDNLANINADAIRINSGAVAYVTGTLAYDTSMVNGARSRGKSGKPAKVKPLPQGAAA